MPDLFVQGHRVTGPRLRDTLKLAKAEPLPFEGVAAPARALPVSSLISDTSITPPVASWLVRMGLALEVDWDGSRAWYALTDEGEAFAAELAPHAAAFDA